MTLTINKKTYEAGELVAYVAELEKENAELKSIADFQTSSNMDRYFQLKRSKEQLSNAKEIIENIIRVTWGEGWSYSLDWKVKAEQFLKEVEK